MRRLDKKKKGITDNKCLRLWDKNLFYYIMLIIIIIFMLINPLFQQYFESNANIVQYSMS